MPEVSYLEYESDSDSNMAAGSPLFTRFPREQFAGNRVNDSFAYLGSAVRNLGDSVPKLTFDSDGVPELGPNGGRVGSMAWQDADNVNITGGALGANVLGSVPSRVVLPWWGTFAELQAAYPNLRLRGFDICDGRISVNPKNSSQSVLMPDLRDNYVFYHTDPARIGSKGQFAHIKDSEPAGAHAHGGTTGSTAITAAQAPTLSTTTQGIETHADVNVIKTVAYGGPGAAHPHSIPTEAAHRHAIDVRPRTAIFVPIMRVW